MSKISILEVTKNLKNRISEAANETDSINRRAKEQYQEIANLEGALRERMARAAQKKKEEAAKEEEPKVEIKPAEKPAEPKEIKVEKVQAIEKPAEKEVKKEVEAKTQPAEKPAEPVSTEAMDKKIKNNTPKENTQKEKAAEKPANESKKTPNKAKENSKPVQNEKKAEPEKTEAKKPAQKPAISVYTPDLSKLRVNIKVVRSAKDEEEEQKKREEKKRQERAQNREQNERRNERGERGDRQDRGDRKNGFQKRENGFGGNNRNNAFGQNQKKPNFNNNREFGQDKDKDDDSPVQRKAAPKAKKNVFIAPTQTGKVDRHPGTNPHDQKKRLSEEEMAAKRRRNAMKERVFMSDEEDEARNIRRGGKKKDKKDNSSMEAIKIENAVITGDNVSIKVLAERIGKPAAEIIKKLFLLGNICTINSEIDFDTAALIADDYGITLEQKKEQTAEETLISGFEDVEENEEDIIVRPPVVTVMGHVDHGKTSLLDKIRSTKVQLGEAGGITQHIGAYTVVAKDRQITFLDTPGHAAFTAMRARGAQATDIAILVVAADDGVMPQTVEAINHAKAAEVPIIVAINKMDKPGADPERVKQELTEYGLVAEEWGGDTVMVPVSALTGEGVDNLLEMILLVADVSELTANPNRMAKGIIIEARLDKGRGPVATVLVQNGTLHVQDTVVAGLAYGRVRALYNDRGQSVKEAGPSMPVEVIGFSEVPAAGDVIYAADQDKLSKQVVEERKEKLKAEKLKSMQKVSLDDLFSKIEEGKVKDLNIIVKADVQGSVEAIKQSLEKLSNEEVRVRVIHGAAGAVTESDVLLASTGNAIIIGFNVRPDATVSALAEKEGVDIRLYRIIYNAIEDVEAAMKGLLAPKFKEEVLGHASVRQLFKVSSVGTIAGCMVTDGKIVRNSNVRLVRDGVVVFEGVMSSLKRFKDDAKEVLSGYECGITLANYNDLKEGDVIEAYQDVQITND